VASLQAGQYYAFQRNAFWQIMGDLFAAGPALEYTARVARLAQAGIALWDVIETCHRPGSLDSSITGKGLKSNDFVTFFAHYPEINQVYFNGQKAAALFNKKVLPGLSGRLQLHTLPSTSPANAGMSYAAKLAAWSIIRNGTHGDPARIRSPGY